MRVLLTRPEPEAMRSALGLARLGHEVTRLPLMRFEPLLAPTAGAQDDAQGFILTSQRAAPFLPKADLNKPVFATGARTADAARALGFSKITSANGDWQDLARQIIQDVPAGFELCHLSGERLRGNLKGLLAAAGIRYRRRQVYRMTDLQSPPPSLKTWLANDHPGAILFYSPATAAIWQSFGLNPGVHQAICLSEACAAPFEPGHWARIAVAVRPDEEALWACLETIG